mmetsp:Transcript_33197/g.91845  ORF Transcript_33197/g.91845 Transcript_33197/m.91845 type:complete len:100 (+) Transcript_33197:2207-2506(+)
MVSVSSELGNFVEEHGSIGQQIDLHKKHVFLIVRVRRRGGGRGPLLPRPPLHSGVLCATRWSSSRGLHVRSSTVVGIYETPGWHNFFFNRGVLKASQCF